MASRIAGSALTAAGSRSPFSGESCKRTIARSRRSRRMRATTSSTRADARPSRPELLQPTTVRSSFSTTRAMTGFVWPIGGRKRTGRAPGELLERLDPALEILRARAAPSGARRGGRARTSGAPPRDRREDRAHQLRVLLGLAGDDEERRLVAPSLCQRLEHARCPLRMGAVVEREHDPCAPRGPRTTASTKTRQRRTKTLARTSASTSRVAASDHSSGSGPTSSARNAITRTPSVAR